jgi:hypothetical protein
MGGTKLFQIYETDLQRLEYSMPRLFEALGSEMNRPEIQVLFQECKEIIGNVRWDYGPPSEIELIKP